MGNEITRQDTATQSLATRLKICLPGWVRLADLDGDQFYLPSVQHGSGDALRQAAQAHREAMAPADADERLNALRALRLGTMARNESDAEARASFVKLQEDLRDVPADILQAACTAYVNEPGTRFFPRGAGELRTFTGPLMASRARRAVRLSEMARAADEEFNEADRITPEQLAAIKAEVGLVTEPYPEPAKPTGLTPKAPTLAAVAEVAKAIGVDLTAKDDTPAAPIEGLSISEIFAQRDRMRAERSAKAIERVERRSVADEVKDHERFLG